MAHVFFPAVPVFEDEPTTPRLTDEERMTQKRMEQRKKKARKTARRSRALNRKR